MFPNEPDISAEMHRRNMVPAVQSKLSDRAEAELMELINGDGPELVEARSPQRSSRRRVQWALAAVSAVAVGGLVFSSLLGGGSHVVAAPPPSLAIQQIDLTKEDALTKLNAAVVKNLAMGDPAHYSYTWWEEAGSIGDGKHVVVPVTNENSIDADGTKNILQTAGQPFDQFRGNVDYVGPDGKKVKPGQTTSYTVGSGDYPRSVLVSEPGLSGTALKGQLDRIVESNSIMFLDDVSGRIDALGWTISDGPLTKDLNLALLDYLKEENSVEFEGEVKDRLGRTGYVFSAEISEGGAWPGSSSLIFDPETGSLIGYERSSLREGFDTPVLERYIAAV